MIDDLITRLLVLHALEISPASLKEFLERTNRIRAALLPLTIKTFNDDLAASPASVFGRYELQRMTAYLNAWRDANLELESFLILVKAKWEESHPKAMDGEDVLPFLIVLLHKHLPNLPTLLANLELARDVDQSHYFYNAMYAATTFVLSPDAAQINEPDFDKYRVFVESLRDRNAYSLLYLQIKLYSICALRMNDYIKQIYANLEIQNIHTYDFEYNGVDVEKRREIANTKVILMHTHIETGELGNYVELTTAVKKYIAYLEFYNSLRRPGANTFDRLREYTYKFPVFEKFLGEDLDQVRISLGDEMRNYLSIPEEKRASVFNLFAPVPDMTMSLSKFMGYLTRQVSHLEDEAIVAKSAAQDHTLMTAAL
jgi:hypothetical protein